MSLRRIVACGGGDLASTSSFLELGWDMTGVRTPKILLVTSAAPTQDALDAAKQHVAEFAHGFSLKMHTLHEFGSGVSRHRTTQLLDECDMVVVIDGHFERM